MHSGVRPPGDDEPHRLGQTQHARQGGLDRLLHGPPSRLDGPAGEIRPIVGEIETETNEPAVPEGSGGLVQLLLRAQRPPSDSSASPVSSPPVRSCTTSPAAFSV